jgi:hypothetical protein
LQKKPFSQKQGRGKEGPVKTIDDLFLNDNEKKAIKEATKLLKKGFLSERSSYLAQRRVGIATRNQTLICFY